MAPDISPISSRKTVPAVCTGKYAGLSFFASCKCSRLIPEQFAFQEIVPECRAVYGHKRLVLAVASVREGNAPPAPCPVPLSPVTGPLPASAQRRAGCRISPS